MLLGFSRLSKRFCLPYQVQHFWLDSWGAKAPKYTDGHLSAGFFSLAIRIAFQKHHLRKNKDRIGTNLAAWTSCKLYLRKHVCDFQSKVIYRVFVRRPTLFASLWATPKYFGSLVPTCRWLCHFFSEIPSKKLKLECMETCFLVIAHPPTSAFGTQH